MNDFLLSVTAQVQHEQDMIAARGKEPISVRLVPQVPVRNRALTRAWIGGGARLPTGTEWPEINGSALQLLAQVECSSLPAELWGGLGPRNGWLAIFLDPKSLEAKVLHFADAGDFRRSPPVGPDCNIAGYDGNKRAEASGYTWAFSRWPVDIAPVVNGKDDPREERRSTIRHERYGRRHDLVDERCLPFDWPTAQMMVGMALAAYERSLPRERSEFLKPEGLAKVATAITQAQQSGASSEEIARMQVDYDDRRAMASRMEYLAANGSSVIERLRILKADIDTLASSEAFSPEAIAPALADMQAMTWMHKSVPPLYRDGRELSHTERLREGVEVFTLPLTTHHPSAVPSWAYDFETKLLDAAKPVYLEGPSELPPELTAFCEAIWGDEAAAEIGGMGHVPWRYVHQFDDKAEETLIELPTCYLVGWMFGDVDNLVITIKKADLARNDFSKVVVQISN